MDIKELIGLLEKEKHLGTYERYEALCLAITALEKQDGKIPYPDGDSSILACPCCGSGEYLHNPDENENQYCGQCGQKINWPEVDDG